MRSTERWIRLIIPDRFELAKLLILVSVVTMAFSGYGIYTLQDSIDEMETFEDDFQFAMEIMNTESFNQSLNLLTASINAGQGSSFTEVVQAMQQSADSFEAYKEARQNLEETYSRYQWLFLFGILGLVAGIVTMLM